MNSSHTSNSAELTSVADLDRLINRMEKAGAPWEDCAAVAIDFLEAQQEKSTLQNPSIRANASG
jgi:hypothetical protein